jgi:hypothetical protein
MSVGWVAGTAEASFFLDVMSCSRSLPTFQRNYLEDSQRSATFLQNMGKLLVDYKSRILNDGYLQIMMRYSAIVGYFRKLG